MRALLSRAPGGPETLELTELPDPVARSGPAARPGEGLRDQLSGRADHRGQISVPPRRPFAPGGEIAGVVEAVGEGVTGWRRGRAADRHARPWRPRREGAGRRRHGDPAAGGAQFRGRLGADPDLRHHHPCAADRAKLREGETLLVLGAAGGVGLAAVELGKAYGARVVAAVSSEEKAEAAKAAGADVAIVYPRGPVRQGRGEGARQPVQGSGRPERRGRDLRPGRRRLYRGRAPRARLGGPLLVIGFPAGIPELPLNLTLLKSCDVRGVFWGAFAARDPQANAAHIRTLFRLWDEGKIAPKVSRTWPLGPRGRGDRFHGRAPGDRQASW